MRKIVHHLIWTRLPRGARRSALFALTHLAASKPSPGARPAEPITVVGCLRSTTGLGQSARLCHSALSGQGFDVHGIDVSSELMQPLDFPDYTFRDGRLLRGPGTLLMHVNAPLMPFVFLSLGRQIVSQKWIVGYWAWELPVVPPEWTLGAAFVHEIWVPSRFVAQAVSARVADVPIRVLPHPVACDVTAAPKPRRHAGRPFTALLVFNMGSGMQRKNPLAAIAAFRTAFKDGQDARLIVKMTNVDLFPEGANKLRAAAANAGNVMILDRTLRPSEMSELYRESDCLVSLHRSEGFGLVVAEAMLHGLPVLSTDWSGTTEFLSSETGFPIGYRLVPARDPQGTYEYPELMWAEPDTMAAARTLQELRGHASEIGKKAQIAALRRFAAEAYAASVRQSFALARTRGS
jgi:glycosyltransferase involved in cell wall biosynthesis